MIAAAVYILGAVVMLLCGILLIRGYGRNRTGLLLWSALCFFGLALSNLLIFVDLVLLPNLDLYFLRLITAVVAMLILLYGLIWEGE